MGGKSTVGRWLVRGAVAAAMTASTLPAGSPARAAEAATITFDAGPGVLSYYGTTAGETVTIVYHAPVNEYGVYSTVPLVLPGRCRHHQNTQQAMCTALGLNRINVLPGGGDDTVRLRDILSADPVTVWAGGGNDTVTGTGNAETLHGEDGRDTVIGAGGDDTIHGGPGDDRLYGDTDGPSSDEGNDTIFGGDGADYLEGSFYVLQIEPGTIDRLDGGAPAVAPGDTCIRARHMVNCNP